MNEKKVRKAIGDRNWEQFNEYMAGQVVAVDSEGNIDFFEEDVIAFKKFMYGVGTICGPSNAKTVV